jgi:hypothetical protein
MTLFFVAVYVLPETWSPPLLLSITGLILLDALTLLLLLRWSGNGGAWDDRHRLAWASGGLGFFIFFGFANDAEIFSGRSCASLLAILGLMVIGILLHRRARKEKSIFG